jgi:DNA polymerase-3 subunit epsilon
MAADSSLEYKLQKWQFAGNAREVFLSFGAADRRNEVNFVAIDFETANYDMRSACSIGAAIVERGRITKTLSALIRPPSVCGRFEPRFTAIHGITEDDVRGAGPFEDLWPDLFPLFDKTVLVAHNMRFDRSVLLRLIAHYGLKPLNSASLCSLGVARRAWPDLGSHSLSAVARHLKIDLNHHNAESDAAASAAIVLCACAKYGAKDINELASLLRCRRELLCGVS